MGGDVLERASEASDGRAGSVDDDDALGCIHDRPSSGGWLGFSVGRTAACRDDESVWAPPRETGQLEILPRGGQVDHRARRSDFAVRVESSIAGEAPDVGHLTSLVPGESRPFVGAGGVG